jgi:hypothetical protein
LDARSRDSADAALSSFLARREMVVVATPDRIASEFIVRDFSPTSALRRFALAIALARVRRTCFAIRAPYLKHQSRQVQHQTLIRKHHLQEGKTQ